MESLFSLHSVELSELLLIKMAIFLAFIIIMDSLYNRVRAFFESKESAIAARDAEIQSLKNTIASLEEMAAQSSTAEVSNFLAERGF